MKTEEGKTINDYLHLYVGCECIADGERFTLTGAQYLPQGTSAYTEEVKDGIPQAWWVGNCEFKLLLRPLSDMTEEEKIEFITASKDWRYYKEIANIRDSPEGLIHECKYKRGTHVIQRVQPLESFDAAQFIYLLSKHFDLFGLHEAGLCLYKEDIK